MTVDSVVKQIIKRYIEYVDSIDTHVALTKSNYLHFYSDSKEISIDMRVSDHAATRGGYEVNIEINKFENIEEIFYYIDYCYDMTY